MRRHLCFLIVLALLGSLVASAPVSAAPDGSLNSAAYNKKKCKKAKTKKQKKKYCKKKKRPETRTPTSNPSAPVAPAPGSPAPTDPNAVVRDDAGFAHALAGSKLHKTSEGTYGYGEYTWNFCAGGQWSYRSYYYAGSTVESNDGGSYQVVEGYHAAADPSYFAGIVQVSTSNGSQYRWGVELRGGGGYMKTNTSSFEEGTFTRTFGAAVC